MKSNKTEFILVSKKEEAESVTSLFFSPIGWSGFSFTSGQYVSITPPGIIGHGKSYTISSEPSEKFVCLTIKRKGRVSSALIDLPLNSKIYFDGPYGYFYPEEKYEEIVMLAGGIGITPFYSVIKDIVAKKKKTRISLFYSNKILKDVVFFEDLNKISKDYPDIKIEYFLTQEKIEHPLIGNYSRIDKAILEKKLELTAGKGYYVCGSIGFVKDMRQLLKTIGVAEADIFTESFF